jgi:hypothetical protein
MYEVVLEHWHFSMPNGSSSGKLEFRGQGTQTGGIELRKYAS